VSIDDRELWEEMERENRNRADLTPYEQGCHYRQALNEGLYPSIRKMAMSIGVDVSQAAKVIRLADLPREVIAAFPTPGAIQVNWATALGEALARDPDGMVKRAKQIMRDANKAGNTRPTAKQVLEALTRAEGVEPSQVRPAEIQIGDQRRGQLATIKFGRDGLRVEIKDAAVTVVALEQALRRLLKV
jgi:ParB family chromosome partitioning protein